MAAGSVVILAFLTAAADGAPAAEKVHLEKDGRVLIEAEDFHSQEKTGRRRWVLTTAREAQRVEPDGDPSHAETAGGKAYLEVLPDTRRTHRDKLIRGENFADEPGTVAVVHYRVRFQQPGRYFVWVRAYSTGSEDNGIHVGLDGRWPESGRRLQWCEGKNSWRWESKQRTEVNHCGEPGKIFLDIDQPGLHTVSVSMREDGFEFDRMLLTRDPNHKPEN